jgi:hypothetical protein
MAKTVGVSKTYVAVKKSRTGVHAKTKSSKMKTSKNYRKLYRGQGK